MKPDQKGWWVCYLCKNKSKFLFDFDLAKHCKEEHEGDFYIYDDSPALERIQRDITLGKKQKNINRFFFKS